MHTHGAFIVEESVNVDVEIRRHKAGLIIPCVISAVKSTPPMRAGTTTQLCLPFLLTRLSRGVTGIYHSNADESEFLLTRPSRGVTQL